jgi:hypothetical protein
MKTMISLSPFQWLTSSDVFSMYQPLGAPRRAKKGREGMWKDKQISVTESRASLCSQGTYILLGDSSAKIN